MTRPHGCGYDTRNLGVIDGMSGTRHRVTTAVTVAVTAGLLLSGCASTTAGTPISVQATPSPVDATAAPTTAPKTTPRPSVDPYAELRGVVKSAMTDVSRFWAQNGVVVPVTADVVTDRDDADCIAPGKTPAEEAAAIAWACDMVSPPSVAMDAANLDNKVYEPFSDVAVYLTAAHETAHIGLPIKYPQTNTGDTVEERRADCAAGAYMAWVVDGSSPTVSVTEGQVSTATVKMWGKESPRTEAAAFGFAKGLEACATSTPKR